MYGQFVQAVADGRHAKVDDIKSIANGKVWTGEQALSMKLIDQIARLSRPRWTTPPRRSASRASRCWCIRKRTARRVLDLLFGDVSQWLPSREKLMEQQTGFYYLWK